MTEPEGTARRTEPNVVHQGFVALAALGIAALLIVAAGVTGVWMGMRGGSHSVMWGGTVARAAQAAPGVEQPATGGFELGGLPADVVEHYDFARANADVYEQVPCFCGCQDMLAHRNLEDCFVTADGAWESHASGCQVCIEESQMVMRMMGGGMAPEMMHDRIVASFGGPMMGT
jgi:hypothetical protein